MYQDVFHKKIKVNEYELDQSSPDLAELNKGFIEFIENPFDPIFVNSRALLRKKQDSLFHLSAKQAQLGARIIAWSEALTIVIRSEEKDLVTRARDFSRENKVYFLITFASIEPGKIEPGKKFIENKAVLTGPDGAVLNVFLKNKPVPVVEPCVAGDGKVPVVETPYGRLAVSICYDADFPTLMRQSGKQQADILLLPAGDWKEIAPYHAQVASVRAIENGVSLLRPVSGANTIATDYRGRLIGTKNYYDSGEKVMIADVPVHGVRTLYSIIGDVIAWMCVSASFGFLIMAIRRK
jgi:apolipoprotein N-acyltransferase